MKTKKKDPLAWIRQDDLAEKDPHKTSQICPRCKREGDQAAPQDCETLSRLCDFCFADLSPAEAQCLGLYT